MWIELVPHRNFIALHLKLGMVSIESGHFCVSLTQSCVELLRNKA